MTWKRRVSRETVMRKHKAMSRMTVAELKQVVARPEAVEAHDVTASDPRLLVFLKSYRNTVPVPRHWCHKRNSYRGNGCREKAVPAPRVHRPDRSAYQRCLFVRPTPSTRRAFRSCVCAMAWRFHAIDATVGPVAASARGRGG